MPTGARGLAIVAILSLAVLPGSSQAPALRIVSASPAGELDQLADAGQIRIIFSEPMVALGSVPPGTAPPWIRITPAVTGSFFWSGTKTLIFSPDGSAPLPYATRFTVRVDGSAASVSGRSLGTPYELTFTTPTVRLLSAEWYRRSGRFDDPAVISLRFNQPVRPEDVAAHARASLVPHAWTSPALPPRARERWRQTDPAGLARFDDKVAAVRRVTSAPDAVGVRVAGSWNERRFPSQPTRVVLETTSAPPPGGRLAIAIDDTMPSLGGRERHAPHSVVVQLEPAFFVTGISCQRSCESTDHNPIHLTQAVELGAVRAALAVADVTDGKSDRPVTPARSVAAYTQATAYPTLGFLGFDPQPPVTTWKLRLDATLKSADGQTLGYPWVGFVETVHAQPFVGFDGFVWEAGGGPLLPVHSRNVSSMTQWIAPVGLSSVVLRLLELQRESSPLPPGRSVTRPLSLTPDTIQAHTLDLRRLLSPAGTGIVWAAVKPGEVLPRSVPPDRDVRHSLLQITNLGVSVKDSPQSTLVFVTRLDSGAPVADARVAIVDGATRTRWQGTTDRDGVALAPALALRQSFGPRDLSFIVTAEKDGDAAFVGSNWNDDTKPSAWNINYDPGESGAVLRGSVFTDRGVYKEEEDVLVKAVVRDDTPNGMRLLAAGSALDVVMYDARYREVDRRTVTVNRWSSAEWTWRVPDGAALGHYQIAMSRPDARSSNRVPVVGGRFLVAAFRRPDFRVEATLTADPAVLGSTLRGMVEAKYLFGGALGTRPVRWQIRREPVQQAPVAVRERYPEDRYAVGYFPAYDSRRSEGAPLPQKTETLGADGRATITLPTSPEGDAAYTYSLEGDVEDVSGQHIANRAALVVHPASLYVAMSRLPMFVDTKTQPTVGVVAVDLAGGTLVDVPVTVSLVREQWVPVHRPESGGTSDWERRETPAGEWTVRTAAGETPLPIPVREGGSYILRAIARDANGRQTRTDINFYALGPGLSSWRSEGNRIDLTPERETWKPGETARILIRSPWPRATALVTTEREGIRSHRSFTITSTQDTVGVPITEADVPNVYVSVMLVKGRTSAELAADGSDPGQPSFRVGYTELSVDDSSKRLRVDVSADREEYRPRQPVTVSVAVAARDGTPAASEVTLWAMDYGLLSLTKYTTPDVLKAIYVPKPLQVMTGDNRQRLMSRRPMDVPLSGALAEMVEEEVYAYAAALVPMNFVPPAPAAPPPPPLQGAEIRQDFRPLVFWLGSATTGADGRATTTVTLPDSLTTYRIMAVAGDMASQFGFGEREIRVTKPLTLLPAFPRFLSKGDGASFGAVVTNSGKDAGNAVVTIQSLDPDALRFGDQTTRTFRLEPGASEAVRFDAIARGTGSPRVRMMVTLGAETDAFEMPLLVSEPLRPEITAAYGDTTGTATETIALPAGVLPGAGGLTVDLSSTALVGLGETARYLAEYPYECAEQKASRALALLLASDLGGAFTLSGMEPGRYRAEGIRALSALSGFQCYSGGFSLWPGECGSESAYLTAYVLHVMRVGGTLQVPLNARVVTSALDYLEQELRKAPPEGQWWPVWAASHAYSVKVLAEFGRKPGVEITRLTGFAERLPIFALSYLADALAATGDRGPRYQDVVRRLTNAIRIDADRAHVEEIDDDALSWVWNSNVRATAVVLDGFSRRKDDATLVAPLVRWLVAARTNGRWDTTHENAMALEAMVADHRAFESGVPRMTTTVTVGSAAIGTASFEGRSTTAQHLQVPMRELLKQVTTTASPRLSISRTGTGRVYYTARLQSFAPEAPEAVDRGFQVERRYERYEKDGPSAATTSFTAGDLVRVRVAVTIRGEGRFLALTDPLPAGFEPIEGWFQTTARDLAREAAQQGGADWLSQWRRGTFDHVEKHDDRVQAFATRLASGRHEFTYLVRATTAGTFQAAGARVEAMYAPELGGRSQAATVTVK